jgi:hypothetical protein
MDDWKLPWDGGCLCGRIRFRINAPPLLCGICHCRGCQQLTGSVYSLSFSVPPPGFAVLQGEPVIGARHGPTRHYYCGFCKSWLYTVPQEEGLFVNVRATQLDDHAWAVPYMEVMTAEKLPWVTTPARHSFETFPPPEGFAALVESYAREGVRP